MAKGQKKRTPNSTPGFYEVIITTPTSEFRELLRCHHWTGVRLRVRTLYGEDAKVFWVPEEERTMKTLPIRYGPVKTASQPSEA
jgi:hypothetical protein